MLFLLLRQSGGPDDTIKPPLSFAIGNDRRSPYRFKVLNIDWNDVRGGDSVALEVFEGKKQLQRLAWDAPPTVYKARARRQRRSKGILVTASYSGVGSNYHCFTGVWLFSERTRRLKLLTDGIHYGDGARLSEGIVTEEDASRWLFYPPRTDSPDGQYHRTWTYDRKAQRLIPGPWGRGSIRP